MAIALSSSSNDPMLQAWALMQQAHGSDEMTVPTLPAGYQLLEGYAPRPLSNDGEGLWTVFTLHVQSDALGTLIYTSDSEAVVFLTAEESLKLTFGNLDHINSLMFDCTDNFKKIHNRKLRVLKETWHQDIRDPHKRLCVCCWNENYPDTPFPDEASSRLCPVHRDLVQQKGVEVCS